MLELQFASVYIFRIVRVQPVQNLIFRITIGKRPKLNPSEHLHPVSKMSFRSLRTQLSYIILKPSSHAIHCGYFFRTLLLSLTGVHVSY